MNESGPNHVSTVRANGHCTVTCLSQVARKMDGQSTTFRAVAKEVIREGGWVGMFRAAGEDLRTFCGHRPPCTPAL